MASLKLMVMSADGTVKCQASGVDFVDLVNAFAYEEGDCIVLESDEKNIHLHIQLDDALGSSMVYLAENKFTYVIPFNEKRASMSKKLFMGELHYLYARKAEDYELSQYRNLAVNQNATHEFSGIYPHASANVETRGESVFAAKNAIDGCFANLSHGEWPYASWGINMQDDARMKLDFGREVEIDKIILFTRSDFPHDNWWTSVTFEFSDGSKETVSLEKSEKPHVIEIAKRRVSWLEFCDLKKADDPSPFPALTQMEVYGVDTKEGPIV